MASRIFTVIVSLLATLGATTARAGIATSLMQSADVLKPGSFEARAHADIIFNRGGGFNFSPHFQFGVLEDYLDIDTWIGTGTTDFQAGAQVKLNILPDLEGQVGFAAIAGMAYLHDQIMSGLSQDSVLVTTSALVSKSFDLDFGKIVPYSALQVEFNFNNINTVVPLTLLAGARWAPIDTSPIVFYSELQANLSNAFWGLALGAGYPF